MTTEGTPRATTWLSTHQRKGRRRDDGSGQGRDEHGRLLGDLAALACGLAHNCRQREGGERGSRRGRNGRARPARRRRTTLHPPSLAPRKPCPGTTHRARRRASRRGSLRRRNNGTGQGARCSVRAQSQRQAGRPTPARRQRLQQDLLPDPRLAGLGSHAVGGGGEGLHFRGGLRAAAKGRCKGGGGWAKEVLARVGGGGRPAGALRALGLLGQAGANRTDDEGGGRWLILCLPGLAGQRSCDPRARSE